MKFMVISSLKDTAATIPPTVFRQLWEANVEHVSQGKKAGKILEVYGTAGWGRVYSIEEHSSSEELQRHISAAPLGSFINFEVYPLVGFEETAKIMHEMLKAAEKAMPPAK